jgi:quercetin dioxygenase-like cupin family protein
MRRQLTWLFAITAVIVPAGTYLDTVLATPASGFVGTTLAVGRFQDIDVTHQAFIPASPANQKKDVWLSLQKTKGPSDLYVQNNVWIPGGTTGWHTHPGHSLIIVTAGVVTAYEGDDASCTPHEYSVGMGFVDEGGDHVHLLRNEGAVEARTMAVQLVPAGAVRRIDAPAPAGCSF